MHTLLQDFRFTLRTLKSNPVFTIVATLTLALGIGANTAVFSVVNGVLLRDLPYEDPEELTLVWTNFGPDLPQNWVSGPEFAEMREYQTQFEDIGVVFPTTVSFTGAGEPEQIGAAASSGSFFQVLRVTPETGRLFGPEDDRTSSSPVVVLDYGFWQRRFGGESSVLERTLTLGGLTYDIIGVLPPDFRIRHPDAQFPAQIDVWVPIVPIIGTEYEQLDRGGHFLRAFARMKPGVSLPQAQDDMRGAAIQIAEKTPGYYDNVNGWDITVLSLHDDLVEAVKPALMILLGAVLFVLLIACVNVANLQLTRAATREREMALRASLGAGRGRLIRQLLTESCVLALIGSTLGLLVAVGLVKVLVAVAPEALPMRDAIGIDPTVLVFTFGLGLATALLFGLAPGVMAIKKSLSGVLKEGGRGSAGGGSARARSSLVVSEVALAIVLLVGAGLMMQSLNRLLSTDPGYSTEQLLTMQIKLPSGSYDAAATRAFWDQLLLETESVPGVTQAGLISHLPLSGAYQSGTTVVERSATMQPAPGRNFALIEAEIRSASPDYFQTMGIELVAGRTFTTADDIDGLFVAVVDEEFVRRFWPTENPLGQRVSIGSDADGNQIWREVVGVVRHSRHYDLSSVGREAAYYPYAQFGINSMFLAVRTSTAPAAVANAVRAVVWGLDADQPIADILTMEARVGGAVAQPQFNLWLLTGFAFLALLLAAMGIYGVIAYSVGQRKQEVGVRMALGADGASVRSLFLRQGMKLVVFGIGLGIVAALGLTRLLTSLLYDVSATDPVTYIVVALILSVVAAAACLVPALAATRVEPAKVLREG